MYVLTSRVRYSEIDESGALSPLSLINYLQDCSTFHAEDVGAGIAASVERRTAWMIAAWKIRIHRLPSMGESIRIRTWPTGFKGLMSNRNFVMESADAPEGAAPLVEADSAWFLFDVDAGRPRRLVREDLSCYLENDAFEPALDMPAVQRRLRVPRDAEPVVADVVTVTGSHIDTNHHVNNAQYVGMALDALRALAPVPEGSVWELPPQPEPRGIDVQYVAAAKLGDTVVPHVYPLEAAEGGAQEVLVALDAPDGGHYALVKLAF